MMFRQVFAVATLAVVTAGCSGGGGSGGASSAAPPNVPGGTPSAGASFAGKPPTGVPTAAINGVHPGTEKASGTDGTWVARTGGAKVALYLYRGAAALNAPRFCSGTIDSAKLLKLTCVDSNRDRTSGHAALGSGGKTLTVSWDGGIKDSFKRK
jgi:hypothetical protein